MPGIFLGYHSYSSFYKILNLSNNKILLSQSAEFFEDSPSNLKISIPIPKSFNNFIPNSEVRRSGLSIFNNFKLLFNDPNHQFNITNYIKDRKNNYIKKTSIIIVTITTMKITSIVQITTIIITKITII